MRQKLLGIFNSIADAKNVLGLIKKESWNQAEFIVIIGGSDGGRIKEHQEYFEVATENFLTGDSPVTDRPIHRLWPGLKEVEIEGLGTVNVGFSTSGEETYNKALNLNLSAAAIKTVEREISANKVVTFIEIEEELLPKLRLIMDSKGAALMEENQ